MVLKITTKLWVDFINEKDYKFCFFLPAMILFADKTKDGDKKLNKKKLWIEEDLVKNAHALMEHTKYIKKGKPILFFVVYDVSEMIVAKENRPKLSDANNLMKEFLK